MAQFTLNSSSPKGPAEFDIGELVMADGEDGLAPALVISRAEGQAFLDLSDGCCFTSGVKAYPYKGTVELRNE